MIIRVRQFPRVGQSHKMGEVGNETNIQWLIDWVISVTKITILDSLVQIIVENLLSHAFLKHSVYNMWDHPIHN